MFNELNISFVDQGIEYKFLTPYESVILANSNNSFCNLRDFLRRARGPHKMGLGAACGPGAARWAALFYAIRKIGWRSSNLRPLEKIYPPVTGYKYMV